MKLYCFDLDGTLIANHLKDAPCKDCDGIAIDSFGLACGTCGGRGTRLVPVDEGFDHIEVLPKVVDRLLWLAADGRHLAVITNQGGVATGWQTEAQVYDKATRAWGDLALHVFGPRASFHVALDYPKGPEPYRSMAPRRKPSPAMIFEAMTLHHAGPSETIFIGDLPTDEEAALAAGVEYQHPREFFGWLHAVA
jgi:histidinol phosphatase-like enzyme